MSSESAAQTDSDKHSPPGIPTVYRESLELSPELRSDLLDLDAWGEILMTYGRTMRVAVALTDSEGHLLGKCYNPQPIWTLVHNVERNPVTECFFCINKRLHCSAVAEALQRGDVVRVHDEAGLTHLAVPLLLGKEPLGAIIAGQVFDRYPDSLLLRRVAKDFGVSANQLWEVARIQHPVSSAILQGSGDLLFALGRAFLRQRYSAIIEAKLAETNSSFRLLIEGVEDYALFTMDPNGRVTSWNSGADRMLGYVATQIIGQSFACMFTPEDLRNQVPEKQLTMALQTGRTRDEGWRVRRNGKQFWANVDITASLENAGAVRGFTIIMQDTTERKKMVIAREKAQEVRWHLQEKFLSHVSHELRTPLTAIYLFTSNLLDGLLGDLTHEQHDYLTLAMNNVKQLKSMVSDLLDVTRVDTDKLSVKFQVVSLGNLIAEVLNTCRTNAVVRNISLSSAVAPSLPLVWADPARVRQVLINLIDNGIKFSPKLGTVIVDSRPSDDGFLCLSVRDTGSGITPENVELIFDRLAQLQPPTEASRSGLGLGLFISKQLVSQLGGRIWVESHEGRGSTFFFTLPLFSLAKLLADIFTTPNLKAGAVTLIALDLVAFEGAVQADIVSAIRAVLERCIHPAQDLLLPAMSNTEPVDTFFIIACTDGSGFKVIAARILRELQNFDVASTLKPVISSTTMLVTPDQPKEEQMRELAVRIERLVQEHLLGKEKFD
jgi:PAS domain S-box-containing protein